MTALPPGTTIGILGSGQLGRMLALAAARLGFKCHIYSDVVGPAFDVCDAHTVAPYDDKAALTAFAKSISVATYEFENIPVTTVEFLDAIVPVRPAQRRLRAPRTGSTRRRSPANWALKLRLFNRWTTGPDSMLPSAQSAFRPC